MTFRKLDIREETGMEVVFDNEQPDAVIHLAARAGARPPFREPLLYERVNTELASFWSKRGIGRFHG